jgi:hypothetical protein
LLSLSSLSSSSSSSSSSSLLLLSVMPLIDSLTHSLRLARDAPTRQDTLSAPP